jgi:hypothetical protein
MESSALWTMLVPLAINLAVFAYYFGSLAARIRVLEQDFEKMRDTSTRVDDRVHDLAVIMAKVETKMDGFFARVTEELQCPMAQKPRSRRARMEVQDQE